MDNQDNSNNTNPPLTTANPPPPVADYGANPAPTFPQSEPAPIVPNDPEPPAPPSWLNPTSTQSTSQPLNTTVDLNSQNTPSPPSNPVADPLSNPASSFPPIPLENQGSTNNPQPQNPIPTEPVITSTPADIPIAPVTPVQPQTPQPAVNNDSAPTDLSHLIGDSPQNPPNEIYNPPVAAPENLVVPNTQPPPANGAESLNSNGKHANLGKIYLIVGILVLIIVTGLSAYFILGIGKSAPSTSSQPAKEQSPLTNPPKQVPAPTPSPSTESVATSSGSFGNLSSASPSATPKGTSAVDLLKNRKSPSPTPKATP